MAPLTHVPVGVLAPDRFASVLEDEAYARFMHVVERAQSLFHGRVLWNVNSTAKGGGVAEMLRSLLAYGRGVGIDARWVVVEGNPDFFRVTKRIHNHLHGAAGDKGELDERARDVYEGVTAANAAELLQLVEADDVVILHDPQTAGLVPALKKTGAAVVWRCHVGLDLPNEYARGAWDFLRHYVLRADAYVFSRRVFAWEGLDETKISVIPPSIDAFSPKNQPMDPDNVSAILHRTHLLEDGADGDRTFVREDGSPGRVDRDAEKFPDAPPPPPAKAKLVVQVSRWDRLKDPVGVIEAFGADVAPRGDAHLVMAGPAVQAVADDPEGLEVLADAHAAWRHLPAEVRQRVHLVCLPMFDGEENAAIVNALQRRADVVVQKSIAEGFGLTVAEAMWKARPVVASRIGGIQDQIIHGVSGVLLDDATDPAEFGAAVVGLLEDERRAARMGEEAQRRVREEFLPTRHLAQWVRLVEKLVS